MRFGKLKMFFLLQGIVMFVLLCYFGVWMISGKTTGTLVRPYYGNTMSVSYQANGKTFVNNHARYDVPYGTMHIPIRYLLFRPSSSRVNSFMGLAAEPLAWWFVFLLASAMLLLTNNTVFSKGTVFQWHKKFPWLSMDEYFPAQGEENYFSTRSETTRSRPPAQKRLGHGGDP